MTIQMPLLPLSSYVCYASTICLPPDNHTFACSNTHTHMHIKHTLTQTHERTPTEMHQPNCLKQLKIPCTIRFDTLYYITCITIRFAFDLDCNHFGDVCLDIGIDWIWLRYSRWWWCWLMDDDVDDDDAPNWWMMMMMNRHWNQLYKMMPMAIWYIVRAISYITDVRDNFVTFFFTDFFMYIQLKFCKAWKIFTLLAARIGVNITVVHSKRVIPFNFLPLKFISRTVTTFWLEH